MPNRYAPPPNIAIDDPIAVLVSNDGRKQWVETTVEWVRSDGVIVTGLDGVWLWGPILNKR